MENDQKEQSEQQEPAVKVYHRPLEVTVPAELLIDTTGGASKKDEKQKTYWSTMTSRIETETSVKQWSEPPVRTVEGQPPGPEDNPTTREGAEREGKVIGITPNYKIGEGEPKRELNLGRSGFLPNGTGDYKVSMRQEEYKQTFIDPKVVSNANMPHLSTRIPDAKRNVAGDFPSEHSKRSQIKLEPLEQRRFKSSESRPVSTSNYLTESVERHREMEASRLKDYLKAKESDANQPWNKPGWPGPKRDANDESLRELETIKQNVETLKKKVSQSMNDLRVLPTPDEFELDTRPTTSASMLSPLRGDSGWLVRMRRDRLLNEQEAKRKPAKFRSMDQLNLPSMSSNNGGNQLSDPSQVDPLHWQLRKEFHLTKYSERRATSSSYQHIEQSETRVERLQPQPPPAPPAITRSQPTSATITVLPGARGKSPQPLYPPGSLEDVASESKPAVRRPEKVVYENHPIAPSSLDKSVDDYPERLMSPPPTHQPRSILKPRPFEQMSEQERHRIMMENLQRHRSMRSHSVSHKPPQTSFNGPFFRLEQVSPRATSAASMVDMKEMSASSIELESIVWPPKEENQRRRPSSVAHTRNIADPERVEEYQRQKRLEEEAIRRREQQQIISMNKQIRAMEIQQRKLQEQQEQQLKEEDEDLDPMEHHQPQPQQDPAFEPHPVNVYETRPLTANQGERDPQVTWQRTYVVEKRPHDIAKNEILTSEELLEKEQYEVDLLKRRETFVEKPVEPPEIRRIGKRWQPPPEKPYVWPTMRRSQSVEPSRMISPINDDDDEYKWEPIVADPGYKREAKNFTPVSSPPLSPRRGTGVGPLDEPARRQTRNVITPSMDGSHRPKAAFKKERQTPSGGFYPHAPNAIKIVKKRSHSVQSGLLMTANGESSHQQNGRRSGMSEQHHRSYQHRQNAHNEHDVADWEKIYELPPHSSQIVQKDIPRHVDVQRRLTKFEGSIQNLRAASSMRDLDTAHRSYPQPDYDRRYQQTTPAPPPPPPPPPQQHQQRRTHQNSRSGTAASHRQMSRRNSVASTRLESPTHFGGGMSRAASVNVLSPTRPITPGASRARNYIARATAPSPTPMAYDKARAYVPPPLPPGYRLADPQPDPRATSPAPGHTRKMIRSVTDAAQRRHLSPNPSSAASSRFL